MSDKNKTAAKNSPTSPIIMGLFSTGMGLFIILMALDIIHTDPESIHAPRWVIVLAGMMFTAVGLYIFSTGLFSESEQKTPIVQWMQYFLILGMLTAFAAVFLWVGFGSGERKFSSSGSVGFISVSGQGNDIADFHGDRSHTEQHENTISGDIFDDK